jgi:hypothetical protein
MGTIFGAVMATTKKGPQNFPRRDRSRVMHCDTRTRGGTLAYHSWRRKQGLYEIFLYKIQPNHFHTVLLYNRGTEPQVIL